MAAPPAGWRPMRAIVDDDEALMYLRRGTPGDEKRARRLLAQALQQFRALDLTERIKRAEQASEQKNIPATLAA
jgi:hypothetical protein